MADFGHQLAHALEEWNIVGDGVAVGQHPLRVFEIEVDEAGHVIPAAEVEAENVRPQVVDEFFHLIGQRVGFDQRHALDVVLRPATRLGQGGEEIAPPQRLFRRL